jgi:rhodanese-related sulfurtransferase
MRVMFDRVDPLEAKSRLENGAVLIDVREQDEYDQVRVPGATLIPLSEFAARYEEMPKDQEIVLMCAGGVRSAQAAQFAAQHGFKLSNLEGGIKAWHAEGLPVESGGAS